MFNYFPEFIEGVSLFSVKGDKLSKLRCEYPLLVVVSNIIFSITIVITAITTIIVVVVILTAPTDCVILSPIKAYYICCKS